LKPNTVSPPSGNLCVDDLIIELSAIGRLQSFPDSLLVACLHGAQSIGGVGLRVVIDDPVMPKAQQDPIAVGIAFRVWNRAVAPWSSVTGRHDVTFLADDYVAP
jgi:hypothetical protein